MKIFHTAENYIATTLLVLMGLVVISGAAELAYEVVMSMIEPPGFFVGISEPLVIFGFGFLIISPSAGHYLLKIRHKSAAVT